MCHVKFGRQGRSVSQKENKWPVRHRAGLSSYYYSRTGTRSQLLCQSMGSGQLSLLPSAGGKISTGQNAVMLCGWGVTAGMVHSTCEQTRGWHVKPCDPSLTCAIPQRLRGEFITIKRCTNLRLLTYFAFYFLHYFAIVCDCFHTVSSTAVCL